MRSTNISGIKIGRHLYWHLLPSLLVLSERKESLAHASFCFGLVVLYYLFKLILSLLLAAVQNSLYCYTDLFVTNFALHSQLKRHCQVIYYIFTMKMNTRTRWDCMWVQENREGITSNVWALGSLGLQRELLMRWLFLTHCWLVFWGRGKVWRMRVSRPIDFITNSCTSRSEISCRQKSHMNLN